MSLQKSVCTFADANLRNFIEIAVLFLLDILSYGEILTFLSGDLNEKSAEVTTFLMSSRS